MDKDNPKLPQTGKITIIYIAPLQYYLIKGKATYRVREKIPVSSTTQPKPEKVRLSTEEKPLCWVFFIWKNPGTNHVKVL